MEQEIEVLDEDFDDFDLEFIKHDLNILKSGRGIDRMCLCLPSRRDQGGTGRPLHFLGGSMLDFDKLIKDVAAQTTIEDSITVLLNGISKEIVHHPSDEDANMDLATGLVSHLHELQDAVAENLTPAHI